MDEPSLDVLGRRIGRAARAARTEQGRSLGDVARAAGLSKTILGRIERGEGNPSVETLWRLSQALRLPLGALLAEDAAPRVRRIGAGEGEAIRADAGMTAWLLHAEGRGHRSEVFALAFGAGDEQRSGAHLPGTEEVVVCTAGALLVGPLGEEAELGPGDAVWFAADGDHRYLARSASRAVCVILYVGAGP